MPIHTPRLMIRPIQPSDGEAVFQALSESWELFKQWFPWAHQIKTAEDTEYTARDFYARFILRKDFHFLSFKDEVLIGSCSLAKIEWLIPSADIGYWCRPTQQGNGYVTEMITHLADYAFKTIGIKRLNICCDEENIKSIKVAEACGFQLETKALGLVATPPGDKLRMSRRYVKFYESNF